MIAGNRFNGWLSTSRNPNEARDTRVDAGSTLVARSHYYHLDHDEDIDGSEGPYRIVPNFREWQSTTTRSNLTLALRLRDATCRISGCQEGLQVAHIVPQAELDWWMANSISPYNRSLTNSIDDTGNAMLLRADLHIAFDKPRFVFVPKPSGDNGVMRLVLHLLEPSAELEHLYHNRELHPSDVGGEMLFARFAWTLFPLLEAFLSCKEDRRLTVRTTDHDQILDRGYFPAAACDRFSTLSASTSNLQITQTDLPLHRISGNDRSDAKITNPLRRGERPETINGGNRHPFPNNRHFHPRYD
ncbi:hypothetical protein AG0111_0g11654 [Alternaria gaisen]|uniref:Uncharacterized protein n=1 Tax=Alternaria gaisen TaxID=167740 RepID=A0ACB6F6S6_9PLEO|nr:hypothetical protein AG0111_0g11654 [Alternaria gaisen]